MVAETNMSMEDEKTLRELRRTLMLTQAYMADALGIGQESISRLEKRTDVLLSTLHNYVNAMGGELRLVAEFPDRPPIQLKKFGDNGRRADFNVTKLASVQMDRKCR
ncbi:MAG: helix-turn-helix domain-containing protein [Gammaproteobacteria bacterium]